MVASIEGAESSPNSSVYSPSGGGTLLESAGPGVWAGTPVPADCSPGDDGRPLRSAPTASALPEDSSHGLAVGKTLSRTTTRNYGAKGVA